jgi:hypothetical protein
MGYSFANYFLRIIASFMVLFKFAVMLSEKRRIAAHYILSMFSRHIGFKELELL